MFDLLVEETNTYAIDIFLNSTSKNERIYSCVNTNKSEIKLIFSLLLHMGTIKLSRIEDYWRKNILFNMSFFHEHMSQNRFMLLFQAYTFLETLKMGN